MVSVSILVGTRPDAIKLAPIVEAMSRSEFSEPRLLSTGQHNEMLNQVLEVFRLEPETSLNIMSQQQPLGNVTGRVIVGMSELLGAQGSDLLVVQGDTSTALAGALAGYYNGIPVAHVEAGLRTVDKNNPFPEEMNRRLITQLSTLHFAPTKGNKRNLLREGVSNGDILVSGNTVIDALKMSLDRAEPELAFLKAPKGSRVVLVTAHRRESWGVPLQEIALALRTLATKFPDAYFVLPIHKNPVVREVFEPVLSGILNVKIVEPLDYVSFCGVLRRCHLVLTDSGGIQEEAPFLGKPVLVMRDLTERPEGVLAGTAKVVGTRSEEIVAAASELLMDHALYRAMATAANPYGDGQAAERIVAMIGNRFGFCQRPDDWSTSSHATNPSVGGREN